MIFAVQIKGYGSHIDKSDLTEKQEELLLTKGAKKYVSVYDKSKLYTKQQQEQQVL